MSYSCCRKWKVETSARQFFRLDTLVFGLNLTVGINVLLLYMELISVNLLNGKELQELCHPFPCALPQNLY